MALTMCVCLCKLELCIYQDVCVHCGFWVCVGLRVLALCVQSVQHMLILCGWVSVGCTRMCHLAFV